MDGPGKNSKAIRWARERAVAIRKAPLPWIAAAVVVSGFAVERFRHTDSHRARTRVLVARHEVPAGQPVTAIDFTTRSLSEEDPSDALTDQELHRLRGQRTVHPLAAGEVLVLSAVAPVPLGKRLPFGARAYVLDRGAGLPLAVGDRVDVFGGDGERSAPVAENLPIVAVNEDGAPIAAVPDTVVRLLEETRRRGGVTVVLRRPDEPDKARRPARPGARAIPVVEGDQ